MRPFVFIHIPGGSFIFNISTRQHPFSGLEKHIRKPPQLASNPRRGEPIARGGEAENRGAPFQGLMPTLPYLAPWALPRAVLGRSFGAEPLRSVRIFPVFLPGTLKPFASGQRALASRISVHWVIADVKYNIRVHALAHKTGENGMAFSCRWGSLLGGCLIVHKTARACFC